MILKVIILCCFLQLALGRNTPQQIQKQISLSSECQDFERKIQYPEARRNNSVVDDFHGTKVVDPYRWLEDPDSDETTKFIEAQNEISKSFLENCDKWKNINKKLTKLWNYAKYTVPQRHGNYYFFSMNTGLQNQNVFYKQKSLDDEPSVLLDPNELSPDGTVAITVTAFSEDGTTLAYSFSEAGSDWNKIKILDVESGKDYPELLQRVKFSGISWTHDNKGFFYNRYPNKGGSDGSENDKNENQKLYYHRVGEPQERDILVVEFLDYPQWLITGAVSEDGKYLIVSTAPGSNDNLLFYADLTENGEITNKIPLTPFVTEFNGSYSYVANKGTKMVFRTNKGAPNFRLIVIDLKNPDEKNWETLIEENPKDVLDSAIWVDKDKILTIYIQDVKSVLQVHSLETGKLLKKFPLEIGNIVSLNGGKDQSEFFFQLTSFLTPGIIYRYDFAQPDADLIVYREVKLNLKGFDKNNFKVEQVFYPSRDGTKIPMYIIQKKTSNKKPKPCWLYAYGGFAISTMPSFTVTRLFFMDSFDGIMAIANIRGGGEYGEKWHDAGRLLNKQNVFDDFQAAAKYLVKNDYTQHEKIAIQGRSNGGLLVGACLTQRPDLFGAAIAQVGVMDMLRYHKFTIGAAWIPDYGNPDEKVHFDNIYKYSPLHNVRAPKCTKNQYPPTLITTADHDDRVSPLHSLKFAATMQHTVRDNKFQKNPIILRVYSDAGHGAGIPTAKAIEGDSDVLTFMYRALRVDDEF